MTYPRRADIAVAEYAYRHEAEFAAGFLDDARIPFRLQIDDAGGADAGVTIGRPAVLWVRAEDADRARELLEPAYDASAPPVGEAPVAPPGEDSAAAPRASAKGRAYGPVKALLRWLFGGVP